MKKNLRNSLTLCVVAGVLSVSGGMAAYAAAEVGMVAESTFNGPGGVRGMGIKMEFSQLVSEGKINQETADNISAYMEEQRTTRQSEGAETVRRKAPSDGEESERIDMFSEMVTAGIISQEEAEVLKAACTPADGEGQIRGRGFKMLDTDSLVAGGIIDEATAASINTYMDAKIESFKSEMESMERPEGIARPEGMEKPERMALPEGVEMNGGPGMGRSELGASSVMNPFDELVEEGIITQEQADAILATLPEPPAKPEI